MTQPIFPSMQVSPREYMETYRGMFGIEFQTQRESFAGRINQLVSQTGYQVGIPAYDEGSFLGSNGIIWNGLEFELATFIDYTFTGYIQFYTKAGIYVFSRETKKFAKNIPKSSRLAMYGNIGPDDTHEGTQKNAIIFVRYFPMEDGVEFFSDDFSHSFGKFSECMTSDVEGYDFVTREGNIYFHIHISKGVYSQIELGQMRDENGYYPYFDLQGEYYTLDEISRLKVGKIPLTSRK